MRWASMCAAVRVTLRFASQGDARRHSRNDDTQPRAAGLGASVELSRRSAPLRVDAEAVLGHGAVGDEAQVEVAARELLGLRGTDGAGVALRADPCAVRPRPDLEEVVVGLEVEAGRGHEADRLRTGRGGELLPDARGVGVRVRGLERRAGELIPLDAGLP